MKKKREAPRRYVENLRFPFDHLTTWLGSVWGLGWLVVIVPKGCVIDIDDEELDTDAWCKVVYDRKNENEKKQTRRG